MLKRDKMKAIEVVRQRWRVNNWLSDHPGRADQAVVLKRGPSL